MYTYKISNEQTEKIKEKTQNYSDLLKQFKDVDDKYKLQSQQLNLERKTFEKPTNEQVIEQAKNSLEEQKNSSLKGIEDNYQSEKNVIEEKIKIAKDDGEKKQVQTKDLYENLKDKTSKDALKRGLARSSIVINILDAFDKDMVNELNKINSEIQTKVNSLDTQKSLLEEQRQNALNSFDISYAIKLSNKIDEINKEINNQEQKVIEYNNQIAQKEAEYKKKIQDSYDAEANEKLKREEKFDIAKDYLMSMSKQDAMAELDSNAMFNIELGAGYFNKLKSLINAKKED